VPLALFSNKSVAPIALIESIWQRQRSQDLIEGWLPWLDGSIGHPYHEIVRQHRGPSKAGARTEALGVQEPREKARKMSTSKPEPAAIATWTFGKSAVEAAGELLCKGRAALDAVEKGINVVELDASVTSVGFGSLPNAEGIVELDAAIMDGTTYRAGSVCALRNIKCAISVARKVMEETPHVMLAGENALAFALSRGFREEELLTPESRRRWHEWKSGPAPSHDTVSLVALDCAGRLAAGCSTSGLAYKLPGRVGDSPILGAGLYADGEVGGAGATGIGEEIMRFCASFLVVEFMRNGSGPAEACRKVLDRIASKKPADREVNICLIALARNGECGAAGMQPGFPYAVWTPAGVQMRQAE